MTLPLATIRRVLEGGEATCARAGIPIAGGHTIDAPEPIYGLVAIGIVDPARLKRNSDARAGDAIVLGKPLGVGIYGAALKRGALSDAGYRAMLDSTTRLNTPGVALAELADVHALTDVTGFGLLGHLLEMCRAANVGATVDFARLPMHPGVPELARDLPRLSNCVAFFACEVIRTIDVNDHTLFIAEVSRCDHSDHLPLVFFSSRYHLGPGTPVDR